MTNHTHLPWEVRGQFIGPRAADDCGIQLKVARVAGLDDESAANAEFIVRACNSHDELVDALRSAIGAMEVLGHPKNYGALAKAQNALLKAKAHPHAG